MKISLLSMFLVLVQVLSADSLEKTDVGLKNNPGICLSPLDVPIYYTGNPLEGLNAFAVLPLSSIKSKDTREKIGDILENELKKIGSVVKLHDSDMIGFGTGNLLNIQMEELNDPHILRMNLSVECPVTIKSSNTKSNLRVWSINDFIASASQEDKNELKLAESLIQQFVQNFEFNNPSPSAKPVFYIYN